jgi:hypothetical protein
MCQRCCSSVILSLTNTMYGVSRVRTDPRSPGKLTTKTCVVSMLDDGTDQVRQFHACNSRMS